MAKWTINIQKSCQCNIHTRECYEINTGSPLYNEVKKSENY